MSDKRSQQKNKWTPGECARTRVPLVYTFRSHIKLLNWKQQYVCRGLGAELCRPCACCCSLCELIGDLLSCLGPVLLISSFPSVPPPPIFPAPLQQGSLSSEGRDLMDTSHLELYVFQFSLSLSLSLSLILCLCVCLSLCLSVSLKNNSCWMLTTSRRIWVATRLMLSKSYILKSAI